MALTEKKTCKCGPRRVKVTIDQFSKVLQASTSYLSGDDQKKLRVYAAEGGSILEGEYGWLISVQLELVQTLDPTAQKVFAAARRDGCHYVQFDADGPGVDNLRDVPQ